MPVVYTREIRYVNIILLRLPLPLLPAFVNALESELCSFVIVMQI